MSFRAPKTLPIISLFHNPRVAQSQQAMRMLQERQRRPSGEDAYRLDVIAPDQLPTKDQLQQLASSLHGWDALLADEAKAATQHDALSVLLKDTDALKRPIAMDWDKGTAATNMTDLENLIQSRWNQAKNQ
ncbi:hypothetical protein DM01DRAFT_1411017 [Hesseltinella vesiculosa]|uniref:Uncharacterized protein n=1 Tax=Hesseltinella vesiculosa TaxID=101127 RepID=A0A1X2G506_9FUNG|nr:hypothetical protein DM01DRAFT_1411017 [Hesseltinella vesiculosa]